MLSQHNRFFPFWTTPVNVVRENLRTEAGVHLIIDGVRLIGDPLQKELSHHCAGVKYSQKNCLVHLIA